MTNGNMHQPDTLIHCLIDSYEQLAVSAICILRDTDSANDALQNVAAHLLEKGDKLPPIKNCKAYLHTCVRNEALMILRERKRTASQDPALLSAVNGEPDRATEHFETEDYIRAHLAQFSPEMQEIFLKYALDGYSPREIAAEYGMKPNTIAQRIHRMKNVMAAQTWLYTMLFMLYS